MTSGTLGIEIPLVASVLETVAAEADPDVRYLVARARRGIGQRWPGVPES